MLPGIWASLSIYHFNMIYDYALLVMATNFLLDYRRKQEVHIPADHDSSRASLPPKHD